MSIASPVTNQSASESHDHVRSSPTQISRWRDRLAAIRRRYCDSLAVILAEEIGRTFLRIGALCRKTSATTRRALAIPAYPEGLAPLSFSQDCDYLRTCSEDIQRLSLQTRWAGTLDQQIMVQAHFAGLLWALRNCSTESHKPQGS
jgi:hypothetical protein